MHIILQCDLLTDYVSSPKQSDEEKKERILCALAVQDADVVERLTECLAKDSVYSNHRYMARKLREAIDMKRKHPDGKMTFSTYGIYVEGVCILNIHLCTIPPVDVLHGT